MGIIDLFFPKICVGCGREGQYICLNCQRKLVRPAGICPMCCKPSLDGWTHPRCRTRYGMERLLVGLPYRGVVQECLKKVKYKSAWDIMEFLYQLCEFPPVHGANVTAVPMWIGKERGRGFNQAEMIAKMMGEDYKVPYLVMLTRTRDTKAMFGLTRKERQKNIEGAFAISKQLATNGIRQNRVILVDDVWTTGSTMRECARVLKRVGAKEVWGVVIAR